MPVRPVADILASFEMLYRETSKVRQVPGEKENYIQFQTIRGRSEYWLRPDQVVGLSIARLNDAIARGFMDRMHFVHFENLTNEPEKTMREVYKFLGKDYYPHDFNNVEQITQEDDEIHGFINLHKIRNKVEPVKSRAKEVLGEEVLKMIADRA